jgi:hypothetical protein
MSSKRRGQLRKAVASLATLISWEISKERNDWVVRNQSSTTNMLLAKIKEEVALWSLAGAKALSNIMPRK